MEPQFWIERWQKNEIGFHQREFNSHLQEFWPALGLPAGSHVFVPLCGKSRDLLWLRARRHRVTGVEISPVAVRDFFHENALNPLVRENGNFARWEADGLAILCGDFFSLAAAQLADVTGVFDRASLVALPETLRARYAAHLVNILPPAAQILLVTMEYSQAEMGGPPFAVHETEVRALYEPRCHVQPLFEKDIIDDNPRFRERGLTALRERVYRITPASR